MAASTAYNPYDPTQEAFLSQLSQGETGGASDAFTEGVGGVNLAGTTTDQFGFPQWTGADGSHAAGAYQFEPSTWDSIASQYNLNFSNPNDQSEGAWYLAEQTYSDQNGGASLETALNTGNFSSVQSALASVWPSVTGNASNPQGLAQGLDNTASGDVSSGSGGATSSSPFGMLGSLTSGFSSLTGGLGGSGGSSSSSGGIVTDIENWFLRGGLILLGGIIIAVALFWLGWKQGIPQKAAKAVALAV